MAADRFDKKESDSAAQSGLDHPSRYEKGGEDQPHDRICVARKRFIDR